MGIVGRLDQYASMLAGEFDDYSMSENLLTYSEQFNDNSWSKNSSSISQNNIAAPDGTLTADKLVENTTNAQHFAYKIRTGSNETVTFSVFVKSAERTRVWLQLSNFSTAAAQVNFNLSTATAGTPSANNADYTNNSASIIPYPNGWYRCILTTTKGSVNTTNNPTISTSDSSGNIIYLGDGTSGLYIWGAQLEVGSVATDYTPTTTTAISRVLSSTTNTNITGLSTYFSSGFSENVGAATTLVANVFPPYQIVYDEFAGTLFGSGQGRLMRQNTDKSVIVYNEIDEVTDFRDIVTTGLVLDLDAAQPLSYKGTGTAWNDLSGNGNNGTLTNGPTFSSSNGGSIVFDGTDDNIQLGNTSNIISASQSQITVNTWVKTNVVGVYKKILVNVTVGTQSITGIYFSIGPSPFNTYFGLTTSGGQSAATYTQDISTSVYSNLCGTYDGSNLRLYLNGNLVATQPHTGTIGNTGITRISGYDNNTETWNGNIASAQIYNRALTATEVLQNYNALKHRFGL